MSEIVDKEIVKELVQSDVQALAALDAPEQQETPPAEEKKDADKVDTTPEPEEKKVEPELKAPEEDIKPRPHARQETHRDFDALKDIIKDERKQREEAQRKSKESEEKLASLEKEYKSKVITPEMEKDYEDLREMRRTFQIENDPEFRAKYESKSKEIDQRALGVLRGENISPAVEKFITDSGGVLAMYNSSAQMPRPYQDQTFREFIENTLMGKLYGISRSRFEQAIASGMDLKDEMSREIAEAKTKGSERQKQKQQELEEQFKTSAETTRKSFGKMAEKMDYPANATKEERVKVDQHNERVAKAEKAFSEYMKSGNDPSKLAEVMAKAAHSQILMEEMQSRDADLEERDKRIKELEKKIEDIKKSGATGTRSSSAPTANQPPAGKFMNDAQALEQAFPGKQ